VLRHSQDRTEYTGGTEPRYWAPEGITTKTGGEQTRLYWFTTGFPPLSAEPLPAGMKQIPRCDCLFGLVLGEVFL
jgi:hypothetical protein